MQNDDSTTRRIENLLENELVVAIVPALINKGLRVLGHKGQKLAPRERPHDERKLEEIDNKHLR